ncbi:ORF MSV067 putative mRNA capping enzyme large subunit homolog (vaccinia D1R), similar to SW:P20979 [Melanoplus sanguinipes entomopoxvirus]|uniref:mRNA-capping enzyme catalytic subunit n=1 Tax=Melanoplus sanguinipes entomopoxvirus TaxID=83191 RepID=Q9YW26_MSEPV|nr:ORF MSV067 putative mRNA capping enzyme large subunit homolog (vaccinia D1R), similar to SW:P20979 [Melanoplus sanguinipes entomopoxvirus]AAC97815.1 ORF MSV067 putative mRNA capping enzyme large subunit homolog (vaccinia D1R), similar to SW:P20979 [Melanoplus sanguinipes entomopoxvirus 'O']
MEFNINSIIDKFWQFYSTHNPVDNVHNEIELTYLFDNLLLLSNIASYTETKKKLQLEYIIKYVDKSIKLRQRHEYDYPNFEITNTYMIQKLTNQWTIKKLINKIEENIGNEKFIIAHNTEEDNIKNNMIIPPKKLIMSNVTIHILSSIYFIINGNVRVEFKLKGTLGAADNNKMMLQTYLNNVLTYKQFTSYYIEIEILNKLSKDEFYRDITNAFRYIYSINNLNNFALSTKNISPSVKTFMLPFDSLYLMDKSKYFLTSKIDGEVVQFTVKNGICDIVLYNFIFKNKQTNIPNHIVMKGFGEYKKIDNVKTIYPFVFTEIYSTDSKQKYNTRYEMIKFYNDNIKNKEFDITFKHKPIIPIEKDIVNEAIAYYKSLDEKITDGVILLDKESNIDYKLKIDNTVDVIASLNTHKSPNKIHKDGIYMTFNLYMNDEKNITELLKVEMKSNDLITYDNDINMLKFKNIHNRYGKNILYAPLCCIVEYSFLKSKIVNIRLDKTTKFFKSNYYGNSLKVILDSKTFHEKYVPLDTVGIDYLYTMFKINNEIYDKKNLILNQNVEKYFKEPIENNQQQRPPLNIFTNLIKTEAISIAASKLCAEIPNRHVLSIDIGRGGDINKYYYIGISGMLGTDPDISALSEAQERYNSLQTRKRVNSTVYKFSSLNISILDHDYLNKVKSTYMTQQKIKYFGLIEWQMAIHYSYNVDTKNKILNILKNLSTDGTKVIITCLNGNKIKNLLINNQNIKYKIQDNIYYNISKVNDDKIKVLYDATMTTWLEEYLIYDTIIEDFNKYNFILDDMFEFKDIYNNDAMLVLKTNSLFPRKATSVFYKNILNQNTKDNQVLELMNLFKVYIFKYKSYKK